MNFRIGLENGRNDPITLSEIIIGVLKILKILQNSRFRKMVIWGDTLMMFRFVILLIPLDNPLLDPFFR